MHSYTNLPYLRLEFQLFECIMWSGYIDLIFCKGVVLPKIHINLHDDKYGDIEIKKPVGIWFAICFCFAVICFFSFILVASQLTLFPSDVPEGYYFQRSGLFVNLLSNVLLACTLASALYNLRKSSIYWAFGMFLFDFISTSYWIFTSDWLVIVGSIGIVSAATFWAGSLIIFLYCLKLGKSEVLT